MGYHNFKLGSLKEALEQLLKRVVIYNTCICLISINDTISDELEKHKLGILKEHSTINCSKEFKPRVLNTV